MQRGEVIRFRSWKVKHRIRFERDGQTISKVFERSTRQTPIQNIIHIPLRMTQITENL
jgi:macrodomain Ter protein organizer (MatP/YcbG family)